MAGPDAHAAGRAFAQRLIGLLAAVSIVYVVLHVALPDRLATGPSGCTEEPAWRCFAEIDALGDVRFRHVGDLRWYVGAGPAESVRIETDANSATMDALRSRVAVHAGARIGPLLVDRSPVDALVQEVESGRYREASAVLDAIVDSLSTASADSAAVELAEVRSDIERLATLRRRQQALVEALVPPVPRSFFWTSPAFVMLEAFFWALLGVLTSLLVQTTEAVRRGDFDPAETGIAYAKLAYGPVFALVLVFALMNGLFADASVALRIWTLPLVSFVFGYASRHVARGVDRLLGEAPEARPARRSSGPGPAAVERQAVLAKLMDAYRPADWRELRRQSKALAREVVETEAAGREGR